MEKEPYREAVLEASGKTAWFGDTCPDCEAPIINICTRTAHGFVWCKQAHSCVEVLRKRIERLEARLTAFDRASTVPPVIERKKFWTRRENPFLDET